MRFVCAGDFLKKIPCYVYVCWTCACVCLQLCWHLFRSTDDYVGIYECFVCVYWLFVHVLMFVLCALCFMFCTLWLCLCIVNVCFVFHVMPLCFWQFARVFVIALSIGVLVIDCDACVWVCVCVGCLRSRLCLRFSLWFVLVCARWLWVCACVSIVCARFCDCVCV